jgi:polar amino acid transport system substrate-binding protein
MSELNLACVGCGSLGRLHSEVVSQTEGARLFACVDIDEQKARQFCQRFSAEYYTTEVNEVMMDSNIDAVIITTWHDTHAPLSIQAAQANKHVFIEKPMAMTIEECHAIQQVVADSGIKYMVGFRSRFAWGTRDLKQAIPKPQVTITHCRASNIWGESSWAQDPIKGGGQVLSQACHLADLMYYLNESEPVSVYAVGGTFNHQSSEVIDTVNASIKFANGAVGSFIAGDGGSGGLGFFVAVAADGKSGMVTGHGEDVVFEDASVGESQTYGSAGNGMLEEIPAFIKCIQQDTEPIATEKDGARATILIRKCFESIRTGEIQLVTI